MVYINEWLPNPTGADAMGEFIELYNNGGAVVNLSGWIIKTENGKKFSLAGRSISAHGYLVLKRSVTKLSLRNTDGGLSLYDARGILIDHGDFSGDAFEGKSFSRVDRGTGLVEHYAFVSPTPGAQNKTVNVTVAIREYPAGVRLNVQFTSAEFFAIMMGTAILLAGLILYVAKSHEDLSNLFFGRDGKARREAG